MTGLNLNKYIKFTTFLILIIFAYHYYNLGSTSISNYATLKINSSQEQQKVKDVIEQYKEKIVNNYSNLEYNNKIIKKINLSEELSELDDLKDENTFQIYERIDKIKVKKGQTFSYILTKQSIKDSERQKIINEIGKVLDLKKLGIGQEITFYYTNDINNKSLIEKIVIPLSYKEEINLERVDNDFIAKKILLSLITKKNFHDVIINNSIYRDGVKNDIPHPILVNLIRLYSFDIDFQRDIRVDDQFMIYYEVYLNEENREVAYGDILYANLVLQNKNMEYFIFETSEGIDYFDRSGKNARKALMKTPIDGARLSSGFGMRKHPILGYNVKHKGLDFAAPTGTPIFAAGNGIIEYRGRNGAYGRYIRIRHNNSYKTAYAHLSGYRKGLGKGSRVTQGQIIGYVGSSGRSTGPHLHYEILYNNKQINPLKLKLPSGRELKNEELKKFQLFSSKIYSEVTKLKK
ncbi:MAG: Murein DD-endopeptidase MepM [Alphaproteobacteria bacterium MarineAlpha5_Bin10]|nr:MAG: Murein DD-endopeptidase MepM [Alphaproteobacteria bacterium MarineAlpha5_Bin10]|tara:strand:- start:12413 stop:13798 length:1386 start_codon:yes stop_codon:yes gene_type:complete